LKGRDKTCDKFATKLGIRALRYEACATSAFSLRSVGAQMSDPPLGDPPLGDPPGFDEIAAMSFEDALAELEQIVRRLEAGQVKLDEAIQCYERGAQLKRHCEHKLSEAQQRVDRIVIGPEGAIAAAPAKLD
jgi:exodeoxyribonuclease VII small subunit